ncbi:MAG: L,D-transpeptidase family protein [Sulfuricurvum sp.]
MIKYLKIEANGGWKQIAYYNQESNESDPYFVEELKERLRNEGDLSMDENSSDGYAEAIKNFQKRHGIQPDGRVGSETLAKLNISVKEKITAIGINMERWLTMPEESENFYISVNIPDFTLSIVDDDKTVLSMKAIVGKKGRETPVFNAKMKYIVANPYWYVPITIFREDILPKVRKDVRYLKKERIKIFRKGDYAAKKAINPLKINWKKVNANTFPYILRQDSGAKNALGHLKFVFPNSDDIYIHDTPVKSLFEKNIRTFSSGCIRIQEPLKLAHYLLKNDGNVQGDKNVENFIARSRNKNILLSTPVKVQMNYWTVWVDDAGVANFRDDVYGYDRDLAVILQRRKDSETK